MSDVETDPELSPAGGERKPLRWYLIWVSACAFAFFGVWYAIHVGLGYDAHAYWSAVQHVEALYREPALARDAYLYSPLFAQLVWPLGLLPWPVFYVIWSTMIAVVFIWLLKPLGRTWFVPAFVATLPEILTGNIYALMAAALVLGVSSGPPWVFLGMTKVIGGGVGLLWLTLTRQWRALMIGLATGVVVLGVSMVVNPIVWRQWFDFLLNGSRPTADSINSPALTVMLLVAGLLSVVVGALTRRAWLLAIAMILLSPTIGFNTLTLLAAVPRLRTWRCGTRQRSSR